MRRSVARMCLIAPTPFGSGAPSRSGSETSHAPQSFQLPTSATSAHTLSRGALECSEASTTCVAIARGRLQPLARPLLERAHGRLDRPALLREAVFDAD